MQLLAFIKGLLIADFPPESIIKAYGDYTRLFTDLLTSAAKEVKLPVNINTTSFNCLEQMYPKEEEISSFDAFLITGSSKMTCNYQYLTNNRV